MGKLPVEDGRESLRGDHEVSRAEIAVDQRHLVALHRVLFEPAEREVERGARLTHRLDHGAREGQDVGRGRRERQLVGLRGDGVDLRELDGQRAREAAARLGEIGVAEDAAADRGALGPVEKVRVGAGAHEVLREEASLRRLHADAHRGVDHRELVPAIDAAREGSHRVAAEHEGVIPRKFPRGEGDVDAVIVLARAAAEGLERPHGDGTACFRREVSLDRGLQIVWILRHDRGERVVAEAPSVERKITRAA